MQDIFTPFPFELFKSPDIETLNWVLWLAQDGDWFPVGVSLRKPSWCSQEYTTEEQRESGIRPFSFLSGEIQENQQHLGFPLALTAIRITQERYFRERCHCDSLIVPLPRAPHGTSMALASARFSHLSHSLAMVPVHTGGFLSLDLVLQLASNANCKMYLLLTRYEF